MNGSTYETVSRLAQQAGTLYFAVIFAVAIGWALWPKHKAAYDDGLRDAIGKVMDEWGFRYPGISDVEHVYFYAATSATPDLVRRYFQQAHTLGREFGLPAAQRTAAVSPAA